MKIAFIQGRPSAHPMHVKFAQSVNSEFHYVDFRMRWQDKNKSAFYRVISSFVCAIFFPSKRKYDIFLVDNLHFMPVLMKCLRLIKRNQKIVAYMGSHTLYFLYSHRFSKFNEYLHKQALKQYDALICEGKMAETLVQEILGDKSPKLYTVINGVPNEHIPTKITSNIPLGNKNILFIGHVPDADRIWYKGLDLMIKAFARAKEIDKGLTFTIVGECDKFFISELSEKYETYIVESISFEKETPYLEKHLNNTSLYLHCARGEAYGLTILIALSYGIPAIISEWTGAKEVVNQITPELIAPLNADEIANKIIWYFQLSSSERQIICEKAKIVAQIYTEEKAIHYFKNKFSELEKDFIWP